jgi:RNA polymerase sigma-54 factor
MIPSVSAEECEVVRHRLQRFDPIGCCSVDLTETLLVQLEQLPESTTHLDLARQMIQNNLSSLAEHQYSTIIKRYHINKITLSKVINLIKHLNPKPGNSIQKQTSEYITPDLMVKRVDEEWCVTLNPAILPKLSINQYYAAMAQNAKHLLGTNNADSSFLKYNLQEARFFIKNIQNRQETLLKVASYIVQFQNAFFEAGEHEMKPLILNDVAKALALHPSTISRVTTQKFIHTPRGLFELKYFFSNPVSTKSNGVRSSMSIRARLKQLIAGENKKRPLSDTKIAELLSEEGITIARRTITKYRKLMGIASSNERQSIQH